jgi:aminocarboxymuconate-semialdehyde decarboxylase
VDSVRVIDVHTHVIPEAIVDWLGSEAGPSSVTVRIGASGSRSIAHDNGLVYPLSATFTDPAEKLRQMDQVGIDASVLSLAPELFSYGLPTDTAVAAACLMNDALAEFAAASDGRLRAVATLPMAAPDRAVQEVERAVGDLAMVGVHLGTSVNGRYLDHSDFVPVLQAVAGAGVPLMLHPHHYMTSRAPEELASYHLANVIGNPLETCIAASRLIAGGVFDRHPDLVVQLPHGGGYFPYQLGRLEHAYKANKATRWVARNPPRAYLRNFLFDTVLFDERAVAFLLDVAGADNVVFGSDLPFAEADVVTLRKLAGGDDPQTVDRVLRRNASRAYRV